MPLNAQVYQKAIALLRGSDIDIGVYGISFFLSLLLLFWGVSDMIDSDVDRVLAVQPVFFMVGQSFAVTTMWRDRTMFRECDVYRPTLVNVYATFAFFLLACFFVVHVLANDVKWPEFYVVGSLWVTFTALQISRSIRNRDYAEMFQSVHEDDLEDVFDKIISICRGTVEYQVFVWLSFVVAFFTTQIATWSWDDDDMNVTNKGTVTILALWAITSTIHMAKLSRDREDPVLSVSINEQRLYQLMVFTSWILSCSLCFIMIFLFDIKDWQRFFLTIGWGYTLTSIYAVAKHVRDQREARHIVEDAESKGQQKSESNGHSNGHHIHDMMSNRLDPIMYLTAPLEHRGEAAQLIGQKIPVSPSQSDSPDQQKAWKL